MLKIDFEFFWPILSNIVKVLLNSLQKFKIHIAKTAPTSAVLFHSLLHCVLASLPLLPRQLALACAPDCL